MTGTMMEESAAGKGQGTEHEQGEQGYFLDFHLYSPNFRVELRVRLAE